jgi:dodecin
VRSVEPSDALGFELLTFLFALHSSRWLSVVGSRGQRLPCSLAPPDLPCLRTHTSPDESSGGSIMSVAKVTEISSTSTKSFEDAINQGISRANATLRNVRSAWIKEQQVRVENGRPSEYQVNMMVTFVLDD